jgi:hypothetical protein
MKKTNQAEAGASLSGYVDIPGSSSPFNVVPVGAQNYYRVRQ